MSLAGVLLPTVPSQASQLPFISWKGTKITGPPKDFAPETKFLIRASSDPWMIESREAVGSQKITSVLEDPNSEGKESVSATKTACMFIFLPTKFSKAAASVVLSPTYAPHCLPVGAGMLLE